MQDPLKDFMLLKEAAAYCGVVETTIHNWVKRGLLTVEFTSARQRYLRRSAVAKFHATHQKDVRCRKK